jgi:hypothetical protein
MSSRAGLANQKIYCNGLPTNCHQRLHKPERIAWHLPPTLRQRDAQSRCFANPAPGRAHCEP